jgi:hypothetical protein
MVVIVNKSTAPSSTDMTTYKFQATLNIIGLLIIAWLAYFTYDEVAQDNFVKDHIGYVIGGLILLVIQNIVAYRTRETHGSMILLPTTVIYVVIIFIAIVLSAGSHGIIFI